MVKQVLLVTGHLLPGHLPSLLPNAMVRVRVPGDIWPGVCDQGVSVQKRSYYLCMQFYEENEK